jgi:3-dehydroquinate dehydratase II
MRFLVLHGPNLNLLGSREPDVYGRSTLVDVNERLIAKAKSSGHNVEVFQSNHEGELIDKLQEASREYGGAFDGVVFNPGGFTHTSVAIRDAIASLDVPVVEVHLSNIYAREEFRHHSLISAVCAGVVSGFGVASYLLGLDALIAIKEGTT